METEIEFDTETATWADYEAVLSAAASRVVAQMKAEDDRPITVIMGNPPYSVGQKSANDNAANEHYDALDERVRETYAASSSGVNKGSLYDSYIRAFRWAADKIDANGGRGLIAFISGGGWLDGKSMDGFRKCMADEFDAIYVFNLRGNHRASGELCRREGGNVFGQGARVPITITIAVKRGKEDEK